MSGRPPWQTASRCSTPTSSGSALPPRTRTARRVPAQSPVTTRESPSATAPRGKHPSSTRSARAGRKPAPASVPNRRAARCPVRPAAAGSPAHALRGPCARATRTPNRHPTQLRRLHRSRAHPRRTQARSKRGLTGRAEMAFACLGSRTVAERAAASRGMRRRLREGVSDHHRSVLAAGAARRARARACVR